ncbi:MAG: RHS repeat-associated core domain-containing protein [Prolixibacteraceae bacterium]|nr:RHS repeat-associated core domain-containing protein [Prolixibacteraceae bacterium]
MSEAGREGRRRNPVNWGYNLSGQPELFADRGFTGHEHLKWFNLVNMNGRLYDPLVGRFLSVDPYIQDPGFTQEYNRYSYCLNNPLRYTDPSGYKKAPVKEDAFIMDYANYWNRRMLHGGGSGGSSSGGSGGWFSAYTEASRKGYQGEATGFMNDYYNQVYAPDYNGTMSFHYFTNYSKDDQALEPGCNVLGATAYSVRHDFTIRGGGDLSAGNGYSAALYWANTVNSLYNENAARNLKALRREASGWMKVARKVPGRINSAIDANKFTGVITKSIGKKLFGVGLVFSAVDVYQDPSASNVGWNVADGLVGWAAFVPGLQIPALIYFSARISYDIYDAYNKP